MDLDIKKRRYRFMGNSILSINAANRFLDLTCSILVQINPSSTGVILLTVPFGIHNPIAAGFFRFVKQLICHINYVGCRDFR